MNTNNQKYKQKVTRANTIAKMIISFGGYGVIASIILILLFLVYESMPLIFPADITKDQEISSNSNEKVLLTGIDRYQEVTYLLYENGGIKFFNLNENSLIYKDSLQLNDGEKIISVDKGKLGDELFSVGTNSGRIITAGAIMKPQYNRGGRVINASFKQDDQFGISDSSSNTIIKKITFSENEDGSRFWSWLANARLYIRIYDADEGETYNYDLTSFIGEEKVSNITLSYQAEKLMVGTEDGEIFWFDITDYEDVQLKDHWKVSAASITSLSFLIGDNSLIIGTEKGEVQNWFPVRSQENVFKFNKIHEFKSHSSKVVSILPSPRNRNFVTIDSKGGIKLNYSTTNATGLEIEPTDKKIQAASLSPKANGLILIDEDNNIGKYFVENDHPETNIQTLFGKVWYEGYEEPEFVWQSTGGSDEFESKLSLIPMIFGTLKGTFYAMLFSIPLAVLAAIYVSQFSTKKFAQVIKPTIEIMAALPSVVIGFLAGLYFSPLLEQHLMSVFLNMMLIPILFVVAVFVWRQIPETTRVRFPQGADLIFTLPFVIMAFVITAVISTPLELSMFDGSISQWMYEEMGVLYDQRNSFVVGFALGFAVIPIIFTISEDALSNVPKSLSSASFALGASKWQTVIRIILPAAAGGIFAAVMLGLGRAIGETMIVLMATGNTPIMDLSPFNGFRAMSASIAVEIPEAPVDGTLYRVLFLTALLLFVFTFAVNSIAAWIGDRLRKKYARF
ncbi:MAG: ABC transporter permease subunit [Melioribacteraceae bacterium]|nr:ABC transporter permease subunit [Melioribacteraceae bacterium]